MCLIIGQSKYYGMNQVDMAVSIEYDSWKEKHLISLITIEGIPEFEPLYAHCMRWLDGEPDYAFRNRSRTEIASRMMRMIEYINGMGGLMRSPAYVGRNVFDRNEEKWKLWFECFAEWLKRLEAECDILTRIDKIRKHHEQREDQVRQD